MPLAPYHVRLESPVSSSFRCRRAADSLDIDIAEKSVHELDVEADIATPWALGVIVGASGSGKTTLARAMFGADCMRDALDLERPVVDQFPEDWTYDQCATALAGVGLTSVPCWIRPAVTLSTGQRARAEAALQLAHAAGQRVVVIDEWTSVVDRTVAKVMSHCVQKYARRTEGARIALLSCHYDVLDWLNPDWVIDCNRQQYLDRRELRCTFRRSETLRFDIHRLSRADARRAWGFFSKYHYLSHRLPGAHIECYGVFHGPDQIGFQCFANYVPTRRDWRHEMMHSNRTVIHPDYAGLGLGIKVITATSADMVRRGATVRAKFSSTPVYRAMKKDPAWRLVSIDRHIGRTKKGGSMGRVRGFRENVTTYQFEYVGGTAMPSWADETPPAVAVEVSA